MPPLTNYRRVMHRHSMELDDLDTSYIEEFIEDAQALIEGETEHTYVESDSNYNLARAACTDLAAAYIMIRQLGGKYIGLEWEGDLVKLSQVPETKLQLINKYLARTNQALRVLSQAKTDVLPHSTTPC